MANIPYYERWLELKQQIDAALAEDKRIQELALGFVGIKPQATAIETVARVYCKYCNIYNKLCDIYDQMEQVQRREDIKKMIDCITCRLIELKSTLEDVEAFEFTYSDNALQQMLMIPEDIDILCPYFYPFEIRKQEIQYIVDQILDGNRLGDPSPTPSELLRVEEERLEAEKIKQDEKEAELKRKIAMGEEIDESEPSIVYSPEELEKMRKTEEYNCHLFNIQRMERCRVATMAKIQKFNKDANTYLELAGLKARQARKELRTRAAMFIQKFYRQFIDIKRENFKKYNVEKKLGMIFTSWSPPSAKTQLEKVKQVRRDFRRKYHEEWIQQQIKEKARVFKLREQDIMEDITDEIQGWFREWYHETTCFDDYPFPDEGGSILITRGETFSIEEYIEWKTAEEKRLKAEASNPKSKEDIKAEKAAAKEERKRIAAEAKEKEKKRILDYQKSRLNPDNDPGVYINIGKNIENIQEAWFNYKNRWDAIDRLDAPLDAIRGFLQQLIIENAYQENHLELRPIVDELMRIELQRLRASLKVDFGRAGIALPLIKKRKKPKKPKPTKPEKAIPARVFQRLADAGIVRKYPHTTLDDYWGDRNYGAADCRIVPWTPTFPPPGLGDVRELVKVRCLLTLGSTCPKVRRTHLIVGPKSSGKRTLIYAVATETNSILIDLSPMNVYNKFPGKSLKTMMNLVKTVSRIMQPTVIMVSDADKIFYKKVPKEEKPFDPTRLSRDLFREIVKNIKDDDKILVLGTASEPWLSKKGPMIKAFPSVILMPRTDYASISFILTKVIMKYHGVDRGFDVHSVAQVLRGYNIYSILKNVKKVLNGDRIAKLKFRPLDPMEIVSAVLDDEESVYTDVADYEQYKQWYLGYSAFGPKYNYYVTMLQSQLEVKLKKEKQAKK